MTIDPQTLQLEQVLAHRQPMILIDRIIEFEQQHLRAEVVINPKSIFFQPSLDGVPSWVGIEYMAQSVAAFAGIEQLSRGEDINIGFLLGTRKYISHESVFPSGVVLLVEVAPLYRESDGLGQFRCRISSEQTVFCEANINTFCPPDPEGYLQGVENE